MKELFVQFDLATKLRAKRFSEPCIAIFLGKDSLSAVGQSRLDGKFHTIMNSENTPLTAPSYQQVIDWLDKKELFCSAELRIEDGLFKWYPIFKKTISSYELSAIELPPRGAKTAALEDAINEALKFVK